MSEPAGRPNPMRGDEASSAWRAAAARELAPRGAPPDAGAVDRLVTRTVEGVEVRPVYSDAAVTPGGNGALGVFPFTRGARPGRPSWVVATRHEVTDVEAAAAAIAEDVGAGTSGIVVAVDRAGRLGLEAGLDLSRDAVGEGGIALVSEVDLGKLLSAVKLERTLLWLDAGANAAPFLAAALAVLDEQAVDGASVRLYGGFDPAGALARDGALPRPPSALGAEAAELIEAFESRGVAGRPLAVSSVAVHEAGGDAAQEIGFLLAGVAELLRALEARGVDAERAARAIALEVSVGPDVFGAVAKVRALRLAWSKLLACAGIPAEGAAAPFVAARTSARVQSTLDPWTNAVRGTTEAFAAAVAGVDLLVVRPFDEPLGASDRAARRLARNTQLVLRDEAHLADVADPAGGSGWVEHATAELARVGWAELQRLDAAGGLLTALEAGVVQDGIRVRAQERARAVARRKTVLVGVNDFANPAERRPERAPRRDVGAAGRAAQRAVACRRPSPTIPDDGRLAVVTALVARGDSFAAASQVLAMFAPDAPPSCEALAPRPDAERFQALRDRTAALALAGSAPLRVLLVPLGPEGQARARLGFSQRLFEVGGFEVSTAETLVDGPEALTRAGQEVGRVRPEVVCLAGADEAYATLAEPLARALASGASDAWAPLVVQAGKPPPELEGVLREAGVSGWFFAGGDAVEVLEEILARLGVRAEQRSRA